MSNKADAGGTSKRPADENCSQVTFMKRLDPSNRAAFALGPNTLQITLLL